MLVASTLPLQAEDHAGQKAAVSVTLHAEGSSYVPVNPLVPMSISKTAGGGVSFLSSGINVAPASAAATEEPVLVGNRVMWANTAEDTDFIAEPLPGGIGVEDSWQLRSQQSPENNALKFSLPPGASLRMSSAVAGGAEVVIEGRPLLLIPPASAMGADGRSVPSLYTVSGDELITHVDLSGDVDFPVLVDPVVIAQYGEAGGDNQWQNWTTYSTCGGCFGFPAYANLLQAGAEYTVPAGNYGEWYTGVASSSAARITRVDVTGLTHQPETESYLEIGISESNGKEEYSENGYAGLYGPAPVITDKGYGGTPMAICADGAGGHDGGEQPLCNEAYGGTVFYFGAYLEEPKYVYNWVSISSATLHYIQTEAPNSVTMSGSGLKNGWVNIAEKPWVTIKRT